MLSLTDVKKLIADLEECRLPTFPSFKDLVAGIDNTDAAMATQLAMELHQVDTFTSTPEVPGRNVLELSTGQPRKTSASPIVDPQKAAFVAKVHEVTKAAASYGMSVTELTKRAAAGTLQFIKPSSPEQVRANERELIPAMGIQGAIRKELQRLKEKIAGKRWEASASALSVVAQYEGLFQSCSTLLAQLEDVEEPTPVPEGPSLLDFQNAAQNGERDFDEIQHARTLHQTLHDRVNETTSDTARAFYESMTMLCVVLRGVLGDPTPSALKTN